MAKVIHLKARPESGGDNLITARPWEFRRSDWDGKFFTQMKRAHSERFESHRQENPNRGYLNPLQLPPHHVLKGGMAYTIQGLYAYRENLEKMKEVYYLAGLIDCMINQVNPLLRTDLIKDMYKKVMTLKSLLNMNWYGSLDQALLPVDDRLFNILRYRECLARAKLMKSLYRTIRAGTDSMFNILALEYVFYTPGRGGQ